MDEISEISDELTRLSLETSLGGDAMSLATTTASKDFRYEEDETATIADANAENFEFEADDDNDEWVYVTPVTAVQSFEQDQWLVVTQPESTFIPPELLEEDEVTWDPSSDQKEIEWDPPSISSDILDRIPSFSSLLNSSPANHNTTRTQQTTITANNTLPTNHSGKQQQQQRAHQQQHDSYTRDQDVIDLIDSGTLDSLPTLTHEQQQLVASYQMLLLQHQQLLLMQQQQEALGLQSQQSSYYTDVDPNLREYISVDQPSTSMNVTDPNLLLAQHMNFLPNWGTSQEQQPQQQLQPTTTKSAPTSKSPSPTNRHNVIQDMQFIANFTPNLTRANDGEKEKNLVQFSQQLDWELISCSKDTPQSSNRPSTRRKRGGKK